MNMEASHLLAFAGGELPQSQEALDEVMHKLADGLLSENLYCGSTSRRAVMALRDVYNTIIDELFTYCARQQLMVSDSILSYKSARRWV